MHIIDISWLFWCARTYVLDLAIVRHRLLFAFVVSWNMLGHCLFCSFLVGVRPIPFLLFTYFQLLVFRLSFSYCWRRFCFLWILFFSFASLVFPGRPFLPLGLAFCGRWRDSRLCFVRTIFVGRSFGVVPVWLTNGFLPLHRVWICIYRSGDYVVWGLRFSLQQLYCCSLGVCI